MTDEIENDQGVNPVETDNAPTMINEALRAAELMKAENDRKEALLKKEESLAVERTLGGHSTAGVPQKKEDTPEEYAEKVMKNDL